MPAPKAVLKLVENFENNPEPYRSGKYNETQVRRDFIDPLFKALGWDMDNSAGYYVTSQLLQIVKPYNKKLAQFLLGILNSSLIAYYFKKKYNRTDKTFPEIRIYELASLPIYKIDFSNSADRTSHDKLVVLVEKMLALHRQLAAAKTPQDANLPQRQIDATDKQIDQLVYQLYGLTDEEIALVEGAQS